MAVSKNGPMNKKGKYVIGAGDYFIRDGDETKICVSPNDFQRLFTKYKQFDYHIPRD